MAEATLNQILKQLETLEPEELKQLNQAIQDRLSQEKKVDNHAAFYQALLASGLVTRIRKPSRQPIERKLLKIGGQPVSETIIQERR